MPAFSFDTSPITLADVDRALRNKRNKECPGFNAPTYVPYKRIPALRELLVIIFNLVLTKKHIPQTWASAYMVLIAKSDKTHLPSEFRNIALSNVEGKLFFSIIGHRLQTYMRENKYINLTIQKGFMRGVSGCVEHNFSVHALIKDAKRNRKTIIAVLLDLANAYGSVSHNLIQHALEWFHVPELIRAVIFNYYDKLRAMIVTKDWSTSFFPYSIGVFQGCTLSTDLFDTVFQLIIDYIAHTRDVQPYIHSQTNKRYLYKTQKAYADDLTLITSNVASSQKLVNRGQTILTWTRTIKFKVPKTFCVALLHRKGQYGPHDPCLKTNNEPMRCIILDESFKFLGRYMAMDTTLTESKNKNTLTEKFTKYFETIDSVPIHGMFKVWIYQHWILPHLSWPFTVYDFNITYIKSLHTRANKYLKIWCRLPVSTNVSILYRPRDMFGLQLKSVMTHFKLCQTLRYGILKHSCDENIRDLYHIVLNNEPTTPHTNKWNPAQTLEAAEAQVIHKHKFPSQQHRTGIGVKQIRTLKHLIPNVMRDEVSSHIHAEEIRKMIIHAHSLSLQSAFLKWDTESLIPYELSWMCILDPANRFLLPFYLNATTNTLPTPQIKHIWYPEKHTSATCHMCNKHIGTIDHILAGCPVMLEQHRYNYRNDSVLSHIVKHIDTLYSKICERKVSRRDALVTIPHINKSFVTSGTKHTRVTRKQHTGILHCARDWIFSVDFLDKHAMFPPELGYACEDRPDLVIYSQERKTAVLVELTCPLEKNVPKQHAYKSEKYLHIKQALQTLDWQVHIFAVEVSVRGCASRSLYTCLRDLGMNSVILRNALKDIQHTSIRASFVIFSSYKHKQWSSPNLI